MTPTRPNQHLIATSKKYPDAWKHVDHFRANRGKNGIPDWPDWCFLPLGGAYAIASRGGSIAPKDVQWVSIIGALAAWRVTQGVYRFDPDVFDAVWNTPLTGDLPTSVLFHLPEWCVYIETPGKTYNERPLHGFFAHLEQDANTRRAELRILLDAEGEFVPVPLHLVDGGITDSIQSALNESVGRLQRQGFDLPPAQIQNLQKEAETLLLSTITPIVSLVLYLCSRAAEYRSTGDANPNRTPRKPRPTKTKQGMRFFPPNQPTIWETGFRIGEAIRKATAQAERERKGESGGYTVRPHIRVAHWHTYWTGPRSDPSKRKAELRWLPPIPVNIDDPDNITPTVRRVQPEVTGQNRPQ